MHLGGDLRTDVSVPHYYRRNPGEDFSLHSAFAGFVSLNPPVLRRGWWSLINGHFSVCPHFTEDETPAGWRHAPGLVAQQQLRGSAPWALPPTPLWTQAQSRSSFSDGVPELLGGCVPASGSERRGFPSVTSLACDSDGASQHAVRRPPRSSIATAAAPQEAARDRDLSLPVRPWTGALWERSVTVLRVLAKRHARWTERAQGGTEKSPRRRVASVSPECPGHWDQLSFVSGKPPAADASTARGPER